VTVLTTGAVQSMDEAIERMHTIADALPPSDGVACFNRMYLGVTQTVAQQIAASFFTDPAWMTHLDVVFANLYFSALDDSAHVPRCWAPLIQRRDDPSVAQIQFAIAGMNAHINHDLPIAVVTTCRDLGTSPDAGAHHSDFEKINPVLYAAEQQVRESFETGDVLDVDHDVSPALDIVCNWGILEARAAAWVNAEALWELRRLPPLAGRYLDALDGTVGLASRGLLIPTR
jgi:hypothetical protein